MDPNPLISNAPPPSRVRIRNAAGLVVLAALAALAVQQWRSPKPSAPLPEIARTKLEHRDGRWFARDQGQPFTGWLLDLGPDGVRLARSSISNGVLHGVSEGWYTNGQVQIREHFRDNVSEGVRKKWFPNGRLASEATIVQGAIEGVFRRWYPSGQLAESIEMKAGHPEGQSWAYYESGYLKASTRAQAGRVLSQTQWKDGEQSSPH